MPPSDRDVKKTIEIKVVTAGEKGVRDLANQMGGLNKRVKEISSGFTSFKNIFQAALGFQVAGLGIQAITDMADSMQNLENRIKVLGGGSEKAAETMRGLLNAANETKTSVDGLATIYVRLAASTKEANLSSSSLLQVSKLLQNTFRLSGATTQEATNAAIQLSQGFASGQLRGQELRSVLEQNVVFGDLLTKALGKTRGELYKFAEQGKLTSAVVLKALIAGMDETNNKAAQLGQTFEQTLTIAMNRFKAALNNVNKEFNVSGKFAAAVDFFIKKIEIIGALIATYLVPILIGKLINAIFAVALALKAFALSNPITAGLLALGTALLFVADNFEEIGTYIDETYYKFQKFTVDILIPLIERFSTFTIVAKAVTGALRLLANEGSIKETEKRLERNYQNLAKQRVFEEQAKADQKKALIDDLSKLKNKEEVIDKRAVLLQKLNKEYETGKLSIAEYFDKLEEVDKTEAKRLFKEGKKDLEQYNTELQKFSARGLNRDLQEGKITLEQFNRAVEENKIEVLNEKFAAGKIPLQEYDAELVKISSKFEPQSSLRTGTEDYLKSIGTLSSGIAGAVTKTFSRLEDSLVEFTKTGKFNFNEFAQAILDDLNRIIIRSQIIAPLAKGLLSAFAPGADAAVGGFGSAQGGFAFAAKGGAFENGVQKFASGGIVSKPTGFGMAGGKSGLMGEAGPEAILPLTRNSSGDLGVQATQAPVFINIVNNGGGTVDQKESTGSGGERQIDILINAKVREGIESGRFDRTFDQAYGLKRKGN